MSLPDPERWLQRVLRRAAAGHGFLAVCMALSLAGTATAAFPVTAVVVPAALLLPRRWARIAAFSAFGSALGATALVLVFHHLGWAQIYERFPEMASNETWQTVVAWASRYGLAALFVIAVSPLPQTPALLFFGAASQSVAGIFLVMVAGKLIKYGLFAWVAARFPERFRTGLGRILGLRASG